MKTIWKFPLPIVTYSELHCPRGSVPIHAGLDPSGEPCVWCEVDDAETRSENIHFFVLGTGHNFPDGARNHLGSFVQGPFVWHVYTR